MNTTEFSNSFDILYNNLMSNAAPGVNEYEKSVLLTKAQDEVLKNYFNPKGNKYQEGFDGSAKRQIDFSGLITVRDCEAVDEPAVFDLRARVYRLPEDVFIIINETLSIDKGEDGRQEIRQVVPVRFDEYSRLMSKPYKEPLKYQAWRLVTQGSLEDDDTGSSSQVVRVEVIPHSGDKVSKYTLRYVRRPKPIILIDLSSDYGDVTINGEKGVSECELSPLIHEEILQRAVELAKVAYTGDANGTIQMGQRSE